MSDPAVENSKPSGSRTLPREGAHRQMTSEAAKDLVMLFLVLALIVSGMIAFNKHFRDPGGDAQKDWYYERVAPPGSRKPPSRD